MLIGGGRTLKSALEDKVGRLGDTPFVRFEDAEGRDAGLWTWRRVRPAGEPRREPAPRRRGLGHGDKFNLHLGNCPEFLIFWLAAAKSGTVMVPTNPVSTSDEMAYILAHSEARLAITESRYAAAIAAARGGLAGPLEVVECRPLAPLLAGMKDSAPDVRVNPGDEISMQYTSGTTSKPKGVLLTHANYIYGGEVMAKAMRVLPMDRHLIVLPLFHAGAQLHAFVPMLLVGGSVALMERFSATRFVDQAIRHRGDIGRALRRADPDAPRPAADLRRGPHAAPRHLICAEHHGVAIRRVAPAIQGASLTDLGYDRDDVATAHAAARSPPQTPVHGNARARL